MQHIAWPMQHGMIFIYLISGCPWISSGGSSGSEVPTEKEKGEGGGKRENRRSETTRLDAIKNFRGIAPLWRDEMREERAWAYILLGGLCITVKDTSVSLS